jgi:protein-disulfide isomerase
MSQLTPPVSERDHVEGNADARVTLVEYGDFECPACGQAYGTIKEAQHAFGPNLRFVFRHFPLRSSHPHALEAAKAAEAAAAQGRFWPMHDRLFQHQTRLDSDSLVEHARAIGLDLERFRTDLQGREAETRVREDLSSGNVSEVKGTPSLFINGERYDGPRDRRSLIDALARAAVVQAQGAK